MYHYVLWFILQTFDLILPFLFLPSTDHRNLCISAPRGSHSFSDHLPRVQEESATHLARRWLQRSRAGGQREFVGGGDLHELFVAHGKLAGGGTHGEATPAFKCRSEGTCAAGPSRNCGQQQQCHPAGCNYSSPASQSHSKLGHSRGRSWRSDTGQCRAQDTSQASVATSAKSARTIGSLAPNKSSSRSQSAS